MQHAILDADNYVAAMLRIRDSQDVDLRQSTMAAFDTEMIARGAKAVNESLQEARKSLDVETAKKMQMATHGHGRSA